MGDQAGTAEVGNRQLKPLMHLAATWPFNDTRGHTSCPAHLPPRSEEYPAGLVRPPSTGGSGDVDCAQSISLPISPTFRQAGRQAVCCVEQQVGRRCPMAGWQQCWLSS